MRKTLMLMKLRLGDMAVTAGLPLAILLAGVTVSPFVQIGPGVVRDGTIVTLGQSQGRMGSRPMVVVRLSPGEDIALPAGRGHACRIGDTVRVRYGRTVWGRWPRLAGCGR